MLGKKELKLKFFNQRKRIHCPNLLHIKTNPNGPDQYWYDWQLRKIKNMISNWTVVF